MRLNDGYYWVILLNSGMWQISKVTNGIFLLIGDVKEYHWENIARVGQKIPTDYMLETLLKPWAESPTTKP